MGADPRAVAVVVPTVAAGPLLEECLEAVGPPAGALGEVLVVLNGAPPEARERVAKRFPWVRAIASPNREGFAQACNLGARAARSDRVLLLNDDARPRPGWLEPLLETLETPGPRPTALVMPLVRTEGVPEEAYARNGTLSVVGRNVGGVFEDPERIFYASGCALLYRRDLLGAPFDPTYFAYSEDVLLGWRSRIAGFEVRMAPSSVVDHRGGSTLGRGSFGRTYWVERNRLRNLASCFERATLVKIAPLVVVDLALAAADALLRRRRSLLGLLAAAAWVPLHLPSMLRARREIQSRRRTADAEILGLMSARAGAGDGWGGPPRGGPRAALDRLLVGYCRWVGLPVLEVLERRGQPATRAGALPLAGPATLSVVVVSYRSRPALDRCLETLKKAAGADVGVVIVDNASKDGTAEWIREAHPWATLLSSSRNDGFAAAANRGIAATRGEWALLLNPDTEIAAEALAALRETAARHAEFGVIAPRLVDASGRTQESAHAFPTLACYARRMLSGSTWDSAVGHRARTAQAGPLEVDWVTGACLLLRRDAWEAVGGFDPEYALYFEEVDLQRRLRARGLRTGYCPGITVVHHGRGGAARYSGARVTAYHESLLRYFARHRGPWEAAALRLPVFLRSTSRLVYWAYRSIVPGGSVPHRGENRERALAYGAVIARLFGVGGAR